MTATPAIAEHSQPRWIAFATGGLMLCISSVLLGFTVFGKLPWRDGVNLIALVLSVGGVWLAMFQLVLAVRAVRDARKAAEDTRFRMVATQQLDLLHRVRSIEARLEDGSRQDNVALVADALGDWSRTVSELQGLVSAYGEPAVLQRKLRGSVIAVRKLKHDLHAKTGSAEQVGLTALTKISAVSEEFSREIGRMKAG